LAKTYFEVADLDTRDRYKLLTGLVVPRPIGWIGTKRANGTFNLAPFSFFNVVAATPPTVIFSGGQHADRPKDSVALAEESGEFTVNIVSEAVAAAMSLTAGTYGPDDDEFEIAGLTPAVGRVIGAPLVAESPANLECLVHRIVDIGEGLSRMVVGRVVAIHVNEAVLDGTRILSHELRAVGRMAGVSYVTTEAVFDIERPR
jgi:flavin reductase (DIM6/NTAB) family NADH-FMN oxidoreductase RutF